MTKSPDKRPSGARAGAREYLLLVLLVLAVTVTAWTLIDNGLLNTISSLVN
jgi:hypothetical protein